jgi:hypothetical protein
MDAPPEVTPDGPQVPAQTPAGLVVSTDTNNACAQMTSNVTISRAIDESDVTDYVLYWGSDASTKLGDPIALVAKTGMNITQSLAGAARPVEATHVLAFTKNAAGENATPAAAAISELGQTILQDVSAGQGSDSGVGASITIDTANQQTVIVTNNLLVSRCDLDGTNCTSADLWSTNPFDIAFVMPLVATTTNQLIVAARSTDSQALMYRCKLDGTGCGYTNISGTTGLGANSALDLSAAIDTTNQRLLIAARGAGNKAVLFRCTLDGPPCEIKDVSADRPTDSGLDVSLAIDAANAKLLIAARDASNSGKPALYRCDLDGTNCTYTDISAGQGANSGYAPAVAIDEVNQRLLVVTQNNGLRGLFRCDLDGSNCTYAEVSAGKTTTFAAPARVIVDPAGEQLLIATTVHVGVNERAALFHCNLDGTGCTYVDISPGTGDQQSPGAAWNAAARALLVTYQDSANAGKASLSNVCGF